MCYWNCQTSDHNVNYVMQPIQYNESSMVSNVACTTRYNAVTHTYTWMHAHKYTHIHPYMHTHTHRHTYVWIHACMHSPQIHMHTRIIIICLPACTHACTYAYPSLPAHMHNSCTLTHRQIDRQTDTHACRHMRTHGHRYTYIHMVVLFQLVYC